MTSRPTRASLGRLIARAVALGYVRAGHPVDAAAYVRGYLRGAQRRRSSAGSALPLQSQR